MALRLGLVRIPCRALQTRNYIGGSRPGFCGLPGPEELPAFSENTRETLSPAPRTRSSEPNAPDRAAGFDWVAVKVPIKGIYSE